VDLMFQRFIEVWSGTPELFLLIILASIITPSFWVLLGFLLLFGAHLHFQIGDFGIEIGKALVDVGYAGVGIGFLSGGTGDTFLDGGIAFGQEGAAVFACQINQSAHEDDEVGPEPGAGTVLRFGTGVFGHLFGGGKREGEENE